jgi:DNA-binding transcriptional ArsR family regulator
MSLGFCFLKKVYPSKLSGIAAAAGMKSLFFSPRNPVFFPGNRVFLRNPHDPAPACGKNKFGGGNVFIVILQSIASPMGITKSEIFTQHQNKLATMLKAIAHPARIAILQHLIRANACICGDLVEELGLAQATISQHLRELKAVGLIQGTVEGTSVCYCIDPKTWKTFKKELDALFGSYKGSNGCC